MKRKFLSMALLAVSALGFHANAEDVTNLLSNPDFEKSPIFDGTSLGASGSNATATDGSQTKSGALNVYEIAGWTNITDVTDDFARVFTMPYNTTLYVNSNGSAGGLAVSAPENGSSVQEENSSLLFVEANWCPNATLGVKQDITLPAGVYKLTFDSYVSTTLDNAQSRSGATVGSVSTYKWPTELNAWTNNEVYFVTTSTYPQATISMGYYKSANTGGGASAFMFADNVKLENGIEDQTVWQELLQAYLAAAPSVAELPTTAGSEYTKVMEENKKETYASMSEFVECLAKIQKAIDDANALVAPYAAYQAAKKNIDAIASIETTEDNTSRKAEYLDALVAEAEAATTPEELNAVIAKINPNILAYIKKLTPKDADNAPFDLTFMITNPSFDNDNRGGWAVVGGKNNDFNNVSYGTAEFYMQNFDVSQTLSDMVTGSYRLKVKAYQRPGWGDAVITNYMNQEADPKDKTFAVNAEIYVDGGNEGSQKIQNAASVENTTSIGGAETTQEVNGVKYYIPDNMDAASQYFAKGYYDNQTEITATTSTITFGFRCSNGTGNGFWTIFDDFRLYYTGQLDLTIFKESLATKVAEANGVVSNITDHVPAAVLSNLQKAIEDNDNDDDAFEDEEQFTAAIEAINVAVAAAQAFVAPYDAYQAAKVKATAIYEQNVWSDKDGAESTYTTAISTADAAVANASEIETITTQTSNVIAAVKTFIASVEIHSGEYFDLTGFIQNAGLDALDGWQYSVNPGVSESCAEFYNVDFDFNQTIPSMPAGNYELKVQAFQRPGGYGSVSADSPINAFIYINSDENKTTIKNVMSQWSETALFSSEEKKQKNDEIGDGAAGNVGPADYEADGKYYPNGMTGSRRFFDAEYYENTVLTGVGAGDLKFGFKCTNHAANAWTIFDNFRLYYYGTSINVEISEDETFAAVSDIENANITLTRTLSTENWNTFAVPFDITEGELTDQFGADVKIATYSETADGDNSTVTFSEADELAVTANVPVLIQTPNVKGTEFTFSGKTIKAGSAVAEGEGNFDFVGSYSTITLAAGDYFITSNELREIAEEAVVTLKGTRAYIKAKAGSANIRSFVIGGETVTAIDGIAVEGAEADGAIYNVAGQQVSKEYKGIVIKNGKKYLNK